MKRLITRRDFLKAAGAGAAGVTAMAMLGACSSSGTETETTTTAAAASGEESVSEETIAAVVVDEDNKVTDVIEPETSELSSFIPYHAGMPNLLENTQDTLLTVDPHNRILPCLSDEWHGNDTDDEWTFHIREGVTWVDYEGNYKGDVVAEDWVTALEWVLNYWKNDSYMINVPQNTLVGASEYYNYTLTLSEDEAMDIDIDTFLDMVGIETPDDYTVVYHCKQSVPYFESLATAVFTIPLSQGLIDEIGTRGYKGVSPYTMWYCGPYVFSEFIEDSTKTLVPNPAYWDETCERFDSYTYLRTESGETAWSLFELGACNIPIIPNAQVQIIRDDEYNQWHDYLVQQPAGTVKWGLIFNWGKKNEDGTMDTDWNLAAANENFRQAVYYGLNMYNYAATRDVIDPTSVIRGTMSAPGIATFSDGTDYANHVMELTGFNPNENWSHQDPEKCETYKAAAREELEAQGVTFPIHMDIWAASSQDSGNTYTILKETFEDGLGKDFVDVEIHTYITDKMSEVYTPGYMSVEVQGTGADFCDPMTYLNLLCDDLSGNAEYADMYGHITECENQSILDQIRTYTEMIREADAITGDHDARLNGLVEAEAYAINHVLVFPTITFTNRTISCINQYTKPSYANDTQKQRNVNLETKADFYTTAEYDAIREAVYAEE